MSAALTTQARAPAVKLEPSVVFRCQNFVFATFVRWVERLLLHDEVSLVEVRGKGARSKELALEGQTAGKLVRIGGQDYCPWNLGTMLGLEPTSGAWILLRVPHHGTEVRLALEIDACLLVKPVVEVNWLPPELFRARTHAITGAFPLGQVLPGAVEAIGLTLDAGVLWTAEELESSVALLGRLHPGLSP